MDLVLEKERERVRNFERANGLLLSPPNASASIDRVEGGFLRFLTDFHRPFVSRSIHELPGPGSMD